nr:uncharacterized protein LOC105866846 [Microcebus murinus]
MEASKPRLRAEWRELPTARPSTRTPVPVPCGPQPTLQRLVFAEGGGEADTCGQTQVEDQVGQACPTPRDCLPCTASLGRPRRLSSRSPQFRSARPPLHPTSPYYPHTAAEQAEGADGEKVAGSNGEEFVSSTVVESGVPGKNGRGSSPAKAQGDRGGHSLGARGRGEDDQHLWTLRGSAGQVTCSRAPGLWFFMTSHPPPEGRTTRHHYVFADEYTAAQRADEICQQVTISKCDRPRTRTRGCATSGLSL